MSDIPRAAIDATAIVHHRLHCAGLACDGQPDEVDIAAARQLLEAAWPHLHAAEHGERDCKTANLDRRGSRDVRQNAALRVGAGEGFGFGKVTASA